MKPWILALSLLSTALNAAPGTPVPPAQPTGFKFEKQILPGGLTAWISDLSYVDPATKNTYKVSQISNPDDVCEAAGFGESVGETNMGWGTSSALLGPTGKFEGMDNTDVFSTLYCSLATKATPTIKTSASNKKRLADGSITISGPRLTTSGHRFSTDSDLNAVCKLFGFSDSASFTGNAEFALDAYQRLSGPIVKIGASGAVESIDATEYVSPDSYHLATVPFNIYISELTCKK